MTLSMSVHSLVWFNVIIGAFWALCLRLSASTTEELEALLADAVIAAMHVAHLSHKEFAFALGIDEKQLRRQLAREPGQHLSIYRLLRAPLLWWTCFGPSLMAIVFKRRWQEIKAEAEALRADAVAAAKRVA